MTTPHAELKCGCILGPAHDGLLCAAHERWVANLLDRHIKEAAAQQRSEYWRLLGAIVDYMFMDCPAVPVTTEPFRALRGQITGRILRALRARADPNEIAILVHERLNAAMLRANPDAAPIPCGLADTCQI